MPAMRKAPSQWLWNQGLKHQTVFSAWGLLGQANPVPSEDQDFFQSKGLPLPLSPRDLTGRNTWPLFMVYLRKQTLPPQAPLVTLQHFATEKCIVVFNSQTRSLNLVGQEFLFPY